MGMGRLMTMASFVAASKVMSGMFAPAMQTESGPPLPSTSKLFLTLLPGKPRLAQTAVGGLSPTNHALNVVTLGQQDRPQDVADAFLLPADEGAVDLAVVAELFGQRVPLTARAHAKHKVVHLTALVYSKSARFGRRIVSGQHLGDGVPDSIRHTPDRIEIHDYRLLLRFNIKFVKNLSQNSPAVLQIAQKAILQSFEIGSNTQDSIAF